MNKKSIRDIELYGKKIFLRVDYNVQFSGDRILDDHRLRESIPTIQYLRDKGARIILCSHRGRPAGQIVEELRNDLKQLQLSARPAFALTRLQAVQHCWKKHYSCFDGCAGCAALLDEAFIRGSIGRCAVVIGAECAASIEPSNAMTVTTCRCEL